MKNNLFWDYIKKEKFYILIISLTGLVYNIDLTAGPYFEGQLAQCLADIYNNLKKPSDMLLLSLTYIVVIFVVQSSRYFKRLYVRKFGNNINRHLKMDVYKHFLMYKSSENAGSMMTKAISDVDNCSEGIRKFTTEVFDTGIALVSYLIMLAIYDWKLTIVVSLFQVVAYFIAAKMGEVVAKATFNAKKSAEKLTSSTLDLIYMAITYRIYGQEENMQNEYEKSLNDYENKIIHSNIYENALRPLYQIISMMGIIIIFYVGSNKVINDIWNVAAFTAYISCFTKMAVKSSKAAKLFNAVSKAKVSWLRVKPILENEIIEKHREVMDVKTLEVSNLSFSYGDNLVFKDVNFRTNKGDIIGLTGEIACGKSTLGKMFLENSNYNGSIKVNNLELKDIEGKYAITSYMGHHYELLDESVRNNISLGDKKDVNQVINEVCMHEEIEGFDNGIDTNLGENGQKLSSGQQARIALARTLYHQKGIIVLDDPFSACDINTEKTIFDNLRNNYHDSIIILISHRLELFNQLDKVLFLDEGNATFDTHIELLNSNEKYRHLYDIQTEGGSHE